MRYHDGQLSDDSKLASSEFVEEMTESVIVLLLSFALLNGQLQFALNSAHKHIVDHDVVSRTVESVLDSHKLHFLLSVLMVVEQIEGLKDADKTGFAALYLAAHEITHSEHH